MQERPASRPDDLPHLLDRLRRDRRTDPRRGRREYRDTAATVLDLTRQLVEAGLASEAVPVLRKAVDRTTRALLYLDDSGGAVGDVLQELVALYARALVAVPPANPVPLADWIFTSTVDGPGWPRLLLRDFAPALGEQGIAHLAARTDDFERTGDPTSYSYLYNLPDLREQLAEVSGDVDRYVTVIARNLNSARPYRRIVAVLTRAGRTAEAVDWARRGTAAYPGTIGDAGRLRDDLVVLLLDDNRPQEALAVRIKDFERHPTAYHFSLLSNLSHQVQAPDTTADALQYFRSAAAADPRWTGELVTALHSSGLLDEAWTRAREHPERIPDRLLQDLVADREKTCPADVLDAYRELIDTQLVEAGADNYNRTIGLLRSLRAAHDAAGSPDVFTAYVADLRTRHRRRPTLMAKLDRAGFTG